MNIKAAIIGTAIGIGVLSAIIGPDASTTDNRIEESDVEWSCIIMGNHVCGPNNADGKVAGCYDERGILVDLWPCTAIVKENW